MNDKIFNGNVFYKFTRKSLLANRVRTLVTIIGIMLSMALLTAVIEGAYSGVEFLKRSEISQAGSWHGMFTELDGEQVSAVAAEKEIRSIGTSRLAGWARVGGDNLYKPYMAIQEIDDSFPEMAGVHLTEGRLPESSEEIILPVHLRTYGGLEYEIGQILTLDVGRRVAAGSDSGLASDLGIEPGDELGIHDPLVDEFNEIITDSEERNFTVVGFYERLSWQIEPFECPGYYVLTRAQEGTGLTSGQGSDYSYTVMFTLNKPSSFYKYMQKQSISDSCEVHRDLMIYYGVSGNMDINIFMYGLVAILVILIIFGSVTLIYNSFSISVSERTKQFGILKSVGATKKQIRQAVFYEAGVLAVIGILAGAVIGCAGIGITLWALSGSFARLMPEAGDVRMQLVINPVMLLIAAVLCLITVFISAMIPAARAIRISPIDSIRQSRDINIKSRNVRTSKLRAKLFGFEGVMASKNFKRSRRRTRSVIVSLLLSLVLFISASSFCAYLTDSIERFTADAVGADVQVSINSMREGSMTPQKFLDAAREVEGVDEAALIYGKSVSSVFSTDILNEEGLADPFIESSASGLSIMRINLLFLDDTMFRKLLDKYSLEEDGYFNAESPKGILYNMHNYYVYDQDTGGSRYYSVQPIDTGKKPIELDFYQAEILEGYYLPFLTLNEDGMPMLNYDGYGGISVSENGSQTAYDGGMIQKDAEENGIKTTLSAGAVITEYEYWMGTVETSMIYPMSVYDAMILPDRSTAAEQNIVCSVLADQHGLANDNLKKLLEETRLGGSVYDLAENYEVQRLLVRVVDVFAYGFIILISLIAVANVFNTISTNISLRRREFAMLRSVGMSQRGFSRMMNYECLIYGLRGLLWGLPLSILVTFAIYRVTDVAYDISFYVPWYSIVIAVCSVFAVVFIAMWYAAGKIRGDNTVDALKNENI